MTITLPTWLAGEAQHIVAGAIYDRLRTADLALAIAYAAATYLVRDANEAAQAAGRLGVEIVWIEQCRAMRDE